MSQQSSSNHARYFTPFHFVATPLLLLLLVLAIINLVQAPSGGWMQALIVLLMVIVLVMVHFHSRYFALRAQDRAIRAEESLRYFILTGERLSPDLRMGQIIALRFASDSEFPALAKKALAEKMSMRQIKQAIVNWRTDYNRV